jgi:hypothetical protein
MPAVDTAVAPVLSAESTRILNEEKPTIASGGKAAVTGVSRIAPRSKGSAAVQHGGLTASAESSGSAADASTGMRVQVETQSGITAEALARPTSSKESSSEQTFAAMDASAAPGRQAWVHTGAQQAEAGFQDPALGWVGVRADSNGSGIHAELLAGSADAATALSSHMAGLNEFLNEHRTPVETLTLSTAGGGTESANDRGAGGGMQQGTGDQTGHQLAQSAGSMATSRAPVAEAASLNSPWPTGVNDSAQQTQWVGGHISVMA